MRGAFPSCSPTVGAVSKSPKQPLEQARLIPLRSTRGGRHFTRFRQGLGGSGRRETQSELEQLVPHVAADQALHHAVHFGGVRDRGLDLLLGETAAVLLHELLVSIAPYPGVAP